MPAYIDKEFGNIVLRRSAKASGLRVRLAPSGELRVSMPLYAPVFVVKRFISANRPQIRNLLADHQKTTLQLTSGMQIGKSHSLIVSPTSSATSVKRRGLQIIVQLGNQDSLQSPEVTRLVRKKIIEVLRIEAKSYLPKRLYYLAEMHGFTFQKVRFSHASGRWGSCSSNGTISLNIALMKLPFELIDYVLIHELSHTLHMNHSADFWETVGAADKRFAEHRSRLKNETPAV